MAKYTTQVRSICEYYADNPEDVEFGNVSNIIKQACPKVFNFEYPIFDESYRRLLEEKILRHYYTREIGEETVGLWKLRLQDKLCEIMPYYNQLYHSETIRFNPMYDVDYKEKYEKANQSDKDGTVDYVGNLIGNETFHEDNASDRHEGEATAEHHDEGRSRSLDTTDNLVTNRTAEGNEAETAQSKTNATEDVTGAHTEHTGTADTSEGQTHTTLGRNHSSVTDVTSDQTHESETTENTTVDATQVRDTETSDASTSDNKQNVVTQSTEATNTKNDENKNGTSHSDGTEKTSGHTDTSGSTTNTQTSDSTDSRAYSDTPQGTLADVQTNMYLTNYTYDVKHGTVNDNGATTGTSDTSQNGETTNDETTTENTSATGESNTANSGTSDTTGNTSTTSHGDTNEKIKNDSDTDTTNNLTESSHSTDNTNTQDVTGEQTDVHGNTSNTGITDVNGTETNNTSSEEKHESGKTATTTDVEDFVSDKKSVTNEGESKLGHDSSSRTTDETASRTTDHSKDNTSTNTNNTTSHATASSLEEYAKHVVGKTPGKSFSLMLQEFRSTFLNIDKMVIGELAPLFFGLW